MWTWNLRCIQILLTREPAPEKVSISEVEVEDGPISWSNGWSVDQMVDQLISKVTWCVNSRQLAGSPPPILSLSAPCEDKTPSKVWIFKHSQAHQTSPDVVKAKNDHGIIISSKQGAFWPGNNGQENGHRPAQVTRFLWCRKGFVGKLKSIM